MSDTVQITPNGLGPEIFQPKLTVHPLRQYDYNEPVEVFEFFRRVNLLSEMGPPTLSELDPATWNTRFLVEKYGQQVVAPRPERPLTGWAPDGALPPLPPDVRKGIPLISFSIWKGSVPSRDDPRTALFWERLAESADKHRKLQHILVSDIDRDEIRKALTTTNCPPDGERDADVWKLARHLRHHNIWLADSRELYGNEMMNGRAAEMRSRRRTGPGLVVGSDILRLNLMYDFGGMYLDGNKKIDSLDIFRQTAESATAFALHKDSGNGFFLAPRRHPQIRAFLREIEESYEKDQVALVRDGYSYGGGEESTVGEVNLNRRHSLMERTGPFMVKRALLRSGWRATSTESSANQQYSSLGRGPDLLFATVDDPGQGSWKFPVRQTYRLSRQEVFDRVEDITASLVSDLANKRGHLDFVDIEGPLKALPNPEAGLAAALTFITSRADLRARVTGFSLLHKHIEPNGKMGDTKEFSLVNVARNFLQPVSAPPLLGNQEGWWLRHKKFVRAVALRPGENSLRDEDIQAAHKLTRPDNFGLHRLPQDPWSKEMLDSFWQFMGNSIPPHLGESVNDAIKRMATQGRINFHTPEMNPSLRRELRSRTAAALKIRNYAPKDPLPVPDEARLLWICNAAYTFMPADHPWLTRVLHGIVHVNRAYPVSQSVALGRPDMLLTGNELGTYPPFQAIRLTSPPSRNSASSSSSPSGSSRNSYSGSSMLLARPAAPAPMLRNGGVRTGADAGRSGGGPAAVMPGHTRSSEVGRGTAVVAARPAPGVSVPGIPVGAAGDSGGQDAAWSARRRDLGDALGVSPGQEVQERRASARLPSLEQAAWHTAEVRRRQQRRDAEQRRRELRREEVPVRQVSAQASVVPGPSSGQVSAPSSAAAALPVPGVLTNRLPGPKELFPTLFPGSSNRQHQPQSPSPSGPRP
ncbi:hypothetical protein ACFW9I_35520 [[Kitasatospora] papulosa]|uniref:hypothetical protein n=1 Tax=[Kitasatospora] papulosa TaxID=1464011 RepID=UPI0036B715E2